MSSFATSDANKKRDHQPIRVPTQKGHVFRTAKEQIEDLSGWSLVSEDEAKGVLVVKKSNGLLGGTSTITISIEGPEGVPSTTVNVRSESAGALLSKDRANVADFVRPFFRRVC